MDRCEREIPDLYEAEGRKLRCFLFAPAEEVVSA